MDIWEANNNAAAFTPHPCSTVGQTRCSGDDCVRDTGLCDADGCDFNSFRMGNQNFLGKGMTVDTSRKFTVVTQFLTNDNTTTGTLSAIRRLYVQDGKVVQNSLSNIPGIDATNEITDGFCAQQKTAFGDTNYFAQKGGLQGMGESMSRGMVLALSVWDDYAAYMQWLDSDYPTGKDASTPGVARGTCGATTGLPTTVESVSASASVIFSNIKFGDIGSTFSGTPVSAPPSTSAPTSAPASSHSSAPSSSPSHSSAPSSAPPAQSSAAGTVAQWGQCGGIGFAGPTVCASGFTCHVLNPCEYPALFSFPLFNSLTHLLSSLQTTPSATKRIAHLLKSPQASQILSSLSFMLYKYASSSGSGL